MIKRPVYHRKQEILLNSQEKLRWPCSTLQLDFYHVAISGFAEHLLILACVCKAPCSLRHGIRMPGVIFLPSSPWGPPWRLAGQSRAELAGEDMQTSLHNKPCLLHRPQECTVPPLSPAAVTKASPDDSHLSCGLLLDQGHDSCMQRGLCLHHIPALLLLVCTYRLKGPGNHTLLSAPCTREVFQGATPFYLEIFKICPK